MGSTVGMDTNLSSGLRSWQLSPNVESKPSSSSSMGQVTLGATLEELQTEDQRRILDTISQLRKCGLDGILSLPQIVVCGDQSAGKSSVLEALTEIPFPRNDNLCTRFATEISLRRETTETFVVKVIPDDARSVEDKQRIRAFTECITDLKDVPSVIDAAMNVMGIGGNVDKAFSKDTLSIEINGPDRPQLTLVDIPGLIQTSTRGVSDDDVTMVTEITDRYIEQPRTICLAVVSAANDAANQPILQRVRKFDPKGERTLGVITKPDQLPPNSGSEAKFLELARNEDVSFTLGWHVVKNRRFEEKHYSFEERNAAESLFFHDSNFSQLPGHTVGIGSLRVRLSHLLFEHIKNELPRLNEDLERILKSDRAELDLLGQVRSTQVECRLYLAKLNMECHDICKAALKGNYEHEFFRSTNTELFSLESTSCIARLRAAVQFSNVEFAADLRISGHKYQFLTNGEIASPYEVAMDSGASSPTSSPIQLSTKETNKWIQRMLLRSRGTELIGNFNPRLIGELFWEQSHPWEKLASSHIDRIGQLCEDFTTHLLCRRVPREMKDRIWEAMIRDKLERRKLAAYDELRKLIQDKDDFPINYNHYYTDNIEKRRRDRLTSELKSLVPTGIEHLSYEKCSRGQHYEKFNQHIPIEKIVSACLSKGINTVDMNNFSTEEIVDCLMAIYKVQYKIFVANVTTQVIERQLIRGLEEVFSPMVIITMSDVIVEAIASEGSAAKRQRMLLANRVAKLEEGHRIFESVIGPGPWSFKTHQEQLSEKLYALRLQK